MHTDKDILVKGIKYLGYTVALMFSAPIVIYQAFKNQEHSLYIPVLILGFILALAALFMAFLGIKTIMDSLFGKKQKKK
ncbi:hypothetical protein Celal_0016 [Cellulophaga algicola DSM 14237]|uniref:Uncharacterized protein n=1 Tax=Cellulophaga algicola (strain DSM 14237 / IC166 / ACAM 630) TaxID=688270 RepID=E6X678_CELAD|nr:DUF6095 family protein [Cellulophaga algicola]ADV47378.1 hypothetical protein Celal_0016 [Cellulophaga algicola DSM 14237]